MAGPPAIGSSTVPLRSDLDAYREDCVIYVMHGRISIGDFSVMTHLSVKTLRYYHEVGLLEPTEIDPKTGYRYYSASLVAVAQIVRRFRAVDMPIDELREILTIHDPADRRRVIARHLQRLERQLEQTKAGIDSLQALLQAESQPVGVEYRTVQPVSVIAIQDRIRLKGAATWLESSFSELRRTLALQRLSASGVPGGLWSTELFNEEEGAATVFIPISGRARANGNVKPLVVPGSDLAIARHRGAHSSIDLTYAALGKHVNENNLSFGGPLREYYLADSASVADPTQWVTEIAWPIFRAAN